ncbi:hypothetical protein IMSAGC008_01629 [Muribaculaceae bacterium]|nr:hypothetical protein IMSAGC008_01629 [Muribaculaceae bacterium]
MERHLASSDRIITHDAFLIEAIRAKLAGSVTVNSIISFLQSDIKGLFGFIHLDDIKIFDHFFRQKTFRQLYIRILFHRSLF